MIVGPCTVLTGGEDPVLMQDAGVRVVGAHIAHVATAHALAAAYPEDTLWPGQGHILVPGFVNTHAHLGRHLARGLALSARSEVARYEHALSPEDIYWSAKAALVEGVRHGVTAVFDFHRSDACIELSLSEVVAAASDVGVRVATCYGVCEHDEADTRRAALVEGTSFAEEIARRRTSTLCGLLGVRAGSMEAVDRLIRETLSTTGGAVGMHVEIGTAGAPMREDASLWFGDPVPALWAHAEEAPASLLSLARERGDALSVVTEEAAEPRRRLAAGWGSDAGVNAPPVPAHGPNRGSHYERTLVQGARFAGRFFGEGLGRIAPGAPADFVLIDYDPATELSRRTLEEHLATGLLRARVSGVMVAGEVILDEGRFVQLDEAEVLARARECAARVWERLG